MSQKLVSELIVKLTQQVSGPAAEAKKALDSVEHAMEAIGKQKSAEERVIQLAKAQDVARDKVVQLAKQLRDAETPTQRLTGAFNQAVSASARVSKALETQKATVLANAESLKSLGVATDDLAGSEARLMSEAERAAAAIVKATQEEQRAARQRQSFMRETARAAEEEAAANRRMVADQEAAARRSIAVADQAAAEQVKIAERAAIAKREAWLREATREAYEQAAINKRIVEEDARQAAQRQEAAQQSRAAPMHAIMGIGGMILGGGIEHVGIKAVENAAELEQARFRVGEVSRHDPSESPFADSLADEVSARYPAISRTKALDTYLELRANAAGEKAGDPVDQTKARRNLMIAARAQTAALANGFEMSASDMQNLLKGVEGSGRADDPKAVEKIADAYIRAKQVFGSAIASSMIRDYTANAKSANFSVGDDQFYLSNMVRMTEGNASRLGNEVNQTLATIVGGHMTKGAANWMAKLGLIKKSQIKPNGPSAVQITGGVQDQATLETDQMAWATHTLRSAIEKSGELSEDKVQARMKMLRDAALKSDPKAQIDERFLRNRAEEGLISAIIAQSGWRTSVTDNLAHAIGNERLIERDIGQVKGASGIESADRIAENPVAAFKEFTTALSSFTTVLASPIMKDVGHILDSAAQGITSLTTAIEGFQKSHPDMAKLLAGGAIGGTILGGGALAWGAIDGLLGGFGLKGSAVALDASAAALTRSAAVLAGESVVGGGPGAAAKGGGLLGTVSRFAAIAAAMFAAKEGMDVVDPKGNLGGLTTPIDRWMQRHWGFNFGGVPPDQLLKDPVPTADPRGSKPPPLTLPGGVDEFGRAIDTGSSGEKSGQDLGTGIAKGLEKQSSLVEDQAHQLLQRLATILAQGVTVPIKLDAPSVQAAVSAVHAKAERAVDAMARSTFAHSDFT